VSPWPQPDPNGAMCCLCFYYYHIDLLATDPEDGKKINICIACDYADRQAVKERDERLGV